MITGLVYRGWTHDLVSQPGYESGVSATSKVSASPQINPDSRQPEDKVFDNKTIEKNQHRQDFNTHYSLGGGQRLIPMSPNYAQEVMVAIKLKEANRNLKIDPNDYEASGSSKTRKDVLNNTDYHSNDVFLFHESNRTKASSLFYSANKQNVAFRDRYKNESVKSEQRPDDVQPKPTYFIGREGYTDLNTEDRFIVAESYWDSNQYVSPFLKTDEIGVDQKPPPVGFRLEREAALMGLEFYSTAQAIMAAEKLEAGREAARFEPDQTGPQDNNDAKTVEAGDTAAAPGADEKKSGSAAYDSGFATSDSQPIGDRDESGEGSGSYTMEQQQATSDQRIGVGRPPVEIHDFRTADYPILGLKGLEVKSDGPADLLKIDGGISTFGLRIGKDFFSRYMITPEREPEGRPYQVIGPGRDVVVSTKRRIGDLGPKSTTGTGDVRTYVRDTGPVALSIESSDTYTQNAPSYFLTMQGQDIGRRHVAPELIGTEPSVTSIERHPIDLWSGGAFPGGEVLAGLSRAPYSDDLDLEQYRYKPSFPPNPIITEVTNYIPYDNRTNYLKITTATKVPGVPHDYQSLEKTERQVHNVEKDVENEKTSKITENQLYGKDSPMIQEVVRLKEIVEADKFEKSAAPSEQAQPREEKRGDMLPPRVISPSLDALVWGWRNKA